MEPTLSVASPPPDGSPTWGPRTKRGVILACLLLLSLLVFRARAVIPIVTLSAISAYLLYPMATFFERRLLGGRFRALAVVMAFAVVIMLVTVLALVVVPALFDQLRAFVNTVPGLLRAAQTQIDLLLNEPLTLNGERVLLQGEPVVLAKRLNLTLNEEEVFSTVNLLVTQFENLRPFELADTVFTSLTDLGGPAFSFLGGAVRLTLNLVFLLALTFYLVKDGADFIRAGVLLVPPDYRADAGHLLADLTKVWNDYLRGQVVLALIMGVAMYIMAASLGIPNAAVLGLLAGILEFVPNLGPTLALVPAATLALFTTQSATVPGLGGVSLMLTVIVVWTIMQQIEAVVLIPRVLGSTLNLHPFVVILAVLAGASLGGVLGVLVAAPLVASGRVVLQYIYGKLTDTDPFVRRVPARAAMRPGWPTMVRLSGVLARRLGHFTRWMRTRLVPYRRGQP